METADEKIEHVLRVEADLHRAARCSRPAAFRCASPNSGLLDVTSTLPFSIWNFTARERSFESMRHALDRAGQPIALELDVLVVVLRNHPFVSRETARRSFAR